MNSEVAEAVEELRRAFSPSEVIVVEDGSGGAHVIIENAKLGPRFSPSASWIGGHIPPQYPYADIYPVFIDAGVRLSDGRPFQAPVTHGASFAGRPAIQVSRRNNQINSAPQTAVAKFVKVLDFLEKL
jgi:hypothetical protein